MGSQTEEEAMRERLFGWIEFRDSVIGRLAYMKDSNLAVWEVIMIAAEHEMDAEVVAGYFERPRAWVNGAFNYYEAYRQEIDPLVDQNRAMTFEKLKMLLPGLEKFTPGAELSGG